MSAAEPWDAHHAAWPTKVTDLAEPVRAFVHPRGRQFVAARLRQLAGDAGPWLRPDARGGGR